MDIRCYTLGEYGNAYIKEHFKAKEFACKDGSQFIFIDNELLSILENVRQHFGKPVIINSAYRTPTYNKKIGGSRLSYHCRGMAADIRITGVDPKEIARYLESRSVRGIGLYSTFVHVDVRPVPYYYTCYSNMEKKVSTFK